MKQIIHVALLGEGVPCWRPVEAEHQGDDIYLITGSNFQPENEQWEFQHGEKVRCRAHIFSGGETAMVAFGRA